MSGTNKIGDLPIIKKHFGDLEVIKEVLNGQTIYEAETPTPVTYPSKSDIVLLDLDGNGARRYRVLKNVSGTTYELIWMPDATHKYFGYAIYNSSGNSNAYNGSGVDTALNTTFYGTLTQTAKSAIVDKTITLYNVYDNSTSGVIVGTATKHIYEISAYDVREYLGTSITRSALIEMLELESIHNVLWTRDGNNSYSQFALVFLYTSNGYYSTRYNVSSSNCIRPMFQIDLSKISFTIEA